MLFVAVAMLVTTMQGCSSEDKTEAVPSTDVPSEAVSDSSSSNISSMAACTVTAQGSASLPSFLQGLKDLIPADIKPLIPSEIKEGDIVSAEFLSIMAGFQQLDGFKNQGWLDGACEARPVQVPAPGGNASAEAPVSNATHSSKVSDKGSSIASNMTACTVTATGSASLPRFLQSLKDVIPAGVRSLIPSDLKEGDVVSIEFLSIMAQYEQLESFKKQGFLDGACEARPVHVLAPGNNTSAVALASNATSSNSTRRLIR